MTRECSYTIESEAVEVTEGVVVKRDGVWSTVFRRLSLFWPVRVTMRALRGFWWLFGFSVSEDKALTAHAEDAPHAEDGESSPRQCLSGRKRLRRATRLLLAILPRGLQSALGYPVCTSIGCSLSPEVRVSPTKPCGKGNKRKLDDDDEEEEGQVEQQTWVGFLTKEKLADEEDTAADPDYETSAGETDSEEYCSHNETESDIEVKDGQAVIQDLETGVEEVVAS